MFPLDHLLCDVPEPEGLKERLLGIPREEDAALDARLRDVDVPETLGCEVRETIAEAALDEQLQEVPSPPRRLAQPYSIPYRRRRNRFAHAASAASLILLIGGAMTWMQGRLLLSLKPPRPPAIDSVLLIDRGPLYLTAETVEPFEDEDYCRIVEPIQEEYVLPPSHDPREVVLVSLQPPRPGPAGELLEQWRNDLWRPNDNWVLMRWRVLGFEVQDEPEAWRALQPQTPRPRGIETPLSRRFDREFLLKTGIQPPVFSAAAKELQTLEAPLWSDSESFARTLRQALLEQRLPAPRQIRAEDFVAAMEIDQPPPGPGKIRLHASAGASNISQQKRHWLLVGGSAGAVATEQPLHWTIALESSAAMQQDGAWEIAVQSLQRTLRRLSRRDRVSLLLFGQRTQRLAESLPPTEALRILRRLKPAAAARFVSLGEAVAAGLESPAANMRRRLTLLTHRAEPSPKVAESLRELLAEAHESGLQTTAVDLSGRYEAAPAWSDLAKRAQGLEVSAAVSVSQTCAAISRSLWGDKTIGEEVKVTVRFHPKAVAAYRLVGHEPVVLAGLASGETAISWAPGQDAAALLEVWPQPDPKGPAVTVALAGKTPGGEPFSQKKNISPSQLEAAPSDWTLSLQAAFLAAETAEILRQGARFAWLEPHRYRYLPQPRRLQGVIESAEAADSRLREQTAFKRLIQLLQLAAPQMASRRVVSAKSGVRGIVNGRWLEE